MRKTAFDDARAHLDTGTLRDAWDAAVTAISRRHRTSALQAAKDLMEASLSPEVAWRFIVASAAELAKDSITAIQYEALRAVVDGELSSPPAAQPELDQVLGFMDAMLQNARDLIHEARLLFENRRWARAYTLAHTAAEELAKYFLVMTASFELAVGSRLDWRGLIREAERHPTKIRALLAYDFIAQRQDDLSLRFVISLLLRRDELLMMTTLEPALSTLRSRSLYAYLGVKNPVPQQAIAPSLAEWMIAMSERHLRFAERHRRSALAGGGLRRWWFRLFRSAIYRAAGVASDGPLAHIPKSRAKGSSR